MLVISGDFWALGYGNVLVILTLKFGRIANPLNLVGDKNLKSQEN